MQKEKKTIFHRCREQNQTQGRKAVFYGNSLTNQILAGVMYFLLLSFKFINFNEFNPFAQICFVFVVLTFLVLSFILLSITTLEQEQGQDNMKVL